MYQILHGSSSFVNNCILEMEHCVMAHSLLLDPTLSFQQFVLHVCLVCLQGVLGFNGSTREY